MLCVSDTNAASWHARLCRASTHSLYLHLPFCVRKCAYCDFSSWATPVGDPLIARYIDALGLELQQAADVGLLDGCATAYVGGGTPTLAGAGLVRLVRDLRSLVPELEELSCEANPDSLDDALLHGLPDAGCTRLSLGVQSLDDDELRLLGRIHSASRALDRLEAAVRSGLDVSCDLMCAIEGQDDASFRHTLEQVIDTGVGHVSVYPLQIEEGTPIARRVGDRDVPWNDPAVQASRMQLAAEALGAAGLVRYEVASYARPAHECRHNCAYWTAQPYLGLGTAASSMLTREGYERLRHCAPQLPAIPDEVRRVRLTCTDRPASIANEPTLAARHFELELLDERQAVAEDLMLAMRMTQGAGPGLMTHARSCLGASRVHEAQRWCEARGLARPVGTAWVPTEQGWLLGNELYGRLWELADEPVAGGRA